MGCGQSKNKVDSILVPQKDSAFTLKYDMSSGHELGKGAFGVVIRAIVRQATYEAPKADVAVKCVVTDKMSAREKEELDNEVGILKQLDHVAIVKCLDYFEERKVSYIVMELVLGGELFDRIIENTHYSEKEARDVAARLLGALAYMHDLGFAHRDIKPENLLLVDDQNDHDFKLCDFGFASSFQGKSMNEYCGSPGYLAPEIVKKDDYDGQCDVWSSGVILYILLSGTMPFAASEHLVDDDEITEDLERKIVRGDWAFHSDGPYSWDYISAEAKDLIKKLLTVDPDERWTAKQCLQHPWITKGESDLAASGNLSAVKENLKKFNAKRKLKSAVRSVIMLNRMGLKDLAAAGQASPQRDSAETTRAAEEVDGSQHD